MYRIGKTIMLGPALHIISSSAAAISVLGCFSHRLRRLVRELQKHFPGMSGTKLLQLDGTFVGHVVAHLNLGLAARTIANSTWGVAISRRCEVVD